MTGPLDTSTSTTERAAGFSFRIAGILSWIVGVISLLMATAVHGPSATSSTEAMTSMILGIGVGAAVCAGAFLVQRHRRLGGYIVVGATIVPTVLLAFSGQFRGPPWLLILASITVLANWKHLR
jgi:hypothetical protein